MQLGKQINFCNQSSALCGESFRYGGLTSVRVGSDFPETIVMNESFIEADSDSSLNSDAYYANLESNFEKLAELINQQEIIE